MDLDNVFKALDNLLIACDRQPLQHYINVQVEGLKQIPRDQQGAVHKMLQDAVANSIAATMQQAMDTLEKTYKDPAVIAAIQKELDAANQK